MAPAITDKFTEATNGTRPVPTTLTALRSVGAASITCAALTGWPTATAVHFMIYRIGTNGAKVAGSQTDWKGIVSGSTITGLVLKAGTDLGDSVGAVVEAGPTAAWADDVTEGIAVDHSQTGAHEVATNYDPANPTLETQKWVGVASAVNEISTTNAITGADPFIAPTGDDTNIGLTLKSKGTGPVKFTPGAGGSIVLDGFNNGWLTNALPAVSSVTSSGNRSYDVTFASTVASLLTPGMRLRTSRTVAAPTQCTSLNGSSQYYSKSSPNKLTFTDDFFVSAWVKLTSYNGAIQTIVSRYDGTSGWQLRVDTTGQVYLGGNNAGGGNWSRVTSYQSIPLNRWVHIAAQLDMSAFTATTTTSYIMIDGVNVPASVTRSGTNPTALIQAGNLEIGADAGARFFTGKIAQVAIHDAKIGQSNVPTRLAQTVNPGGSASMASAYDFNGGATDLNTTTPNDLTAQGSAVATNADSPFTVDANGVPGGTYDFGIVTKVATTVATVQVPEGCTIPTTGGVSTVDMSSWKAPFGMPVSRGKWRLQTLVKTQDTQVSPTGTTWYNLGPTSGVTGGQQITVPIGSWLYGYETTPYAARTGSSDGLGCMSTLSTANNTESDTDLTGRVWLSVASAVNGSVSGAVKREKYIDLASATPYYLNYRVGSVGAANTISSNVSGSGDPVIYAEFALL